MLCSNSYKVIFLERYALLCSFSYTFTVPEVYKMQRRKLTLIHYQDPAHGWIKCSIGLLYGLGIADKISGYSYRRNESVYIEEDGDFSILLDAAKIQGLDIVLRSKHTDKSSRIRSYDVYTNPAQQTKTSQFIAEHFKLLGGV